MNDPPQPLQPIDAALLDLIAGNVDARTNPRYRPVLYSALDTLGYPEEQINLALSKLYRMH